ncbi:MAG: pantoate--beta-alanine ligase [Ghiorsea sp.]
MKIITSASELQHLLGEYTQEQIALVATMGCLHEGHLSLVRKAKRLADIVVVSIYVNPLQFGANEDLSNYPQPFEEDAKLCEAEGVDFIFHPANLYPENGMQVGLHANQLSDHLCGAARPGHFDGVVTVVNILFNIVQPHIAIFGEKDFQQLSIIRRLVSDLYLPVEIIEGETVREADGLAISSRNRFLNTEQRQLAAAVPACLQLIQKVVQQGTDLNHSLEMGLQHLKTHGIQPNYLNVCSEHSLEPITSLNTDEPLRIFIAAPVGSARLIDNMPLYPTLHEKDETTCA